MSDHDTFLCAQCNGLFIKDSTDDEAEWEWERTFPDESRENRKMVCTDCYNELMKDGYRGPI
jgi:hypothetical protein